MADRRRARGEGTVRERSDGLWEAPRATRGGALRREATQFLRQEQGRGDSQAPRGDARSQQGYSADIDHLTIGQYLEEWIEGPLRDSVSDKTRDDYAWLCRKHVIPEIGRMSSRS